MALRRSQQKPDTIYLVQTTGQAFFTPDGEGRVWYDSLEECLAEYDAPVIRLMEEPEDF